MGGGKTERRENEKNKRKKVWERRQRVREKKRLEGDRR